MTNEPAGRVKLTKTSVDRAKPGVKRYKVHDSDVAGFHLVVSPSGKKSFYLRYRVGGGRGGTLREPKIGDLTTMTPEQARKIARDWQAEIRAGGDPGGEKRRERSAPSVADLCERYMRDHASLHKKVSSARHDHSLIQNWILPALGRKKVADVTRDDVVRLHTKIQDRPVQANRVLALLSKCFNLAEVWGLRPDASNPTRHVKKYREGKRQRYLSPEETRCLIAVLEQAERDGCLMTKRGNGTMAPRPISPAVVLAIRLMLLTGARSGEILKCRWDWVDIEARVIRLPDSKSGKKVVYLNEMAVDALRHASHVPGNPFVVPGGKPGAPLVNLKDPWEAIRAAAGLEDLRLHDLRHSFASFAVAGGLSLPMIGKLLGHSQPSTTARYAHLADDPVLAAAELTGSGIAAALFDPTDERTTDGET